MMLHLIRQVAAEIEIMLDQHGRSMGSRPGRCSEAGWRVPSSL